MVYLINIRTVVCVCEMTCANHTNSNSRHLVFTTFLQEMEEKSQELAEFLASRKKNLGCEKEPARFATLTQPELQHVKQTITA